MRVWICAVVVLDGCGSSTRTPHVWFGAATAEAGGTTTAAAVTTTMSWRRNRRTATGFLLVVVKRRTLSALPRIPWRFHEMGLLQQTPRRSDRAGLDTGCTEQLPGKIPGAAHEGAPVIDVGDQEPPVIAGVPEVRGLVVHLVH